MHTAPRLRSLILTPLCLSFAACGNPGGGGADPASSAPPAGSGASSAVAAPAVEKLPGFDLKATFGGEPLDFRNAIAFQRPGNEAVEVIVSTAARDCDTAKKNGIALARGEVMFRFAVIEALSPDGKPAWKIVETYFNGSTDMGVDKPAAVEPGDASRPFKIVMEPLSLKASGGEKKQLDVQGAVVAKSCGVIPEPGGMGTPPVRAQEELTLEVAGQRIALKGALYRETRKDILLATIPMSCADTPFSQADVALFIAEDGTTANLQGRRVGSQFATTLKPPLKLEMGKPANGVVEIAVDSDFKVSKWPVKLKGKVSALACAK